MLQVLHRLFASSPSGALAALCSLPGCLELARRIDQFWDFAASFAQRLRGDFPADSLPDDLEAKPLPIHFQGAQYISPRAPLAA